MGLIYDEKEVADAIGKIIKNAHSWDYEGFGFEINNTPFEIEVWFLHNKRKKCGFTLIEQKNCCGILVSTRTFVNKKYRERGLAQEMMPLKEALAKQFNYNLLLATVNMTGSPAEVHILEKFGWNLVSEFVNKKTHNTVGVFTKNLEE